MEEAVSSQGAATCPVCGGEATVRQPDAETFLYESTTAAENQRLRDFAQRVANLSDEVTERIAEVGEPPGWWSGTQIDVARLGDFAREALAGDGE
jgi:uncharacterized Zn finger protein (UPF0148 family)